MLEQNNTAKELITEITKTLNLITKLNYFTYNNKFYTHNDRLPMDSPITTIPAEIFLQHLGKTRILTNIDRHSHKIYWHSYTDDIIHLYKGSTRQCEQCYNTKKPPQYQGKNYESTMSVSYTHLDVYKRQALTAFNSA